MNVNMSKHSSVWIDNLTQHIFTFTEHPELWASDETKQISIFCQIFIMYSNKEQSVDSQISALFTP